MCATMISEEDFKDPFKFEQKNSDYKVSEATDGDDHSDEPVIADID